MQKDFHYYATYCAACLAGYSHDESLEIAYSAQLVDLCSRTFLKSIKGPLQAATTQSQLELANAMTDIVGLQDITRIWASFHFLPYDLKADVKGSGLYRSKYRLICNTNGELAAETVRLAKDRGTQAAGIAMHVLADTWAHRYFAGTPSLVINNVNYHFYEMLPDGKERQITFRHSASAGDDPEQGLYTSSIYQYTEDSIMNLGHGRAGHFPDYSFARYRYLPAWGNYEEIVKDNPSDYMNAFCQMIYALKYLRGETDTFETAVYDTDAVASRRDEIEELLNKRQTDSCRDWMALGTRISGHETEDFELNKYAGEYMNAGQDEKDDTFLGRFIIAALRQKSMVTNRIFKSGNFLAGYSIDFKEKGFKGIRDFIKLTGKQTWER
jgi:hypothetical protein